ncbi:unnamed protein product [Paramecium primaurelia]|uniref:CSC1/OSCA1-like cytosolic domain-containing protein n=1 Tax=Paramecium primaurelia TaxID=5886 RepID=A0A8S1Q0X8_PARPR|nr:unnamed protein product [Paramecium primaurelia]
MFNILKTKSILVQQKSEGYDAFKRPPDFLFAERHGQASRFAVADNEKVQLCTCCGMPIQNDQLPLCCDKQDINFNGAGIPLYFEFIQFASVLLVTLGLISGIYNIITNVQGSSCEQYSNTCSLNYYNKYALSNKAEQYDIGLNVLDLISTIIIIGFTIYYRRWMNLTALEVDNAVITISDFSIQVSNLPLDATEQEIKEFFSKIEKKGVEKQLHIQSICLGWNIQQYTNIVNQKLAKEIQISNLIALEQTGKLKNKQQKIILEQEIMALNKEIQGFLEAFDQKFLLSGVAFITFNTSQEAQECRKFHNQTKIQLLFHQLYYCFRRKRQLTKFKGKTPYVVRAPEPGDIMWENLGEKPWKQISNQTWTNLATLLILGICFGAILGISIGQNSLSKSESKNTYKSVAFIITILGLVASFVISLLNSIMAFTIKKLVFYEKPYTQTDFNISYANKLGMSQFINTAIIPLLVNLTLQDEQLLISLWKSGGLNSDVSLILIMNAIFPWVINLFDPFYFWKLIKRQRIKNQGNQCTLTQREANILFEGTKSDLSQKYATIVKALMLTFFYAQLLPIGIPIALAFLLINYWVEKYLLLRRQSKNAPLGKQLAEEMIDLYIELTLLLFAAGNCIWQKVVVGEINAIVWTQLAVAGFQFLLPIDWIFEWFFNFEEAQTTETYEQQKNQLWDDYLKRNPVTQQKSIEQWIKEQGGDSSKKVQGFLQKLEIKYQQDITEAQHKLIKKFVPKDLINSHYDIRKNQVLPNNLEESLLIKQQGINVQKPEIRQAESIYFAKRETEFVPNRPQIKQADSFTYD